MRNLKRVLALALALVMVIGMMVIGSSAASYTDASAIDSKYAEAVEVLSGMGIFKGQDANNFAPKAHLTRAEASALIYRVITGDVTDSKIALYDYASFDDVVEGAWSTGYITYAANGGYVKGDGTGNFNPTDYVTGVQVLAIMLRAIGYGQNGEYEGAAWKDNVLTDAYDLRITEGIAANDLDKPATREMVAQLIWNAISGPNMVTYLTNTQTYIPVTTKEQNWFKTTNLGKMVFGLTALKHYVVGNQATGAAATVVKTAFTADSVEMLSYTSGLEMFGHYVTGYYCSVDGVRGAAQGDVFYLVDNGTSTTITGVEYDKLTDKADYFSNSYGVIGSKELPRWDYNVLVTNPGKDNEVLVRLDLDIAQYMSINKYTTAPYLTVKSGELKGEYETISLAKATGYENIALGSYVNVLTVDGTNADNKAFPQAQISVLGAHANVSVKYIDNKTGAITLSDGSVLKSSSATHKAYAANVNKAIEVPAVWNFSANYVIYTDLFGNFVAARELSNTFFAKITYAYYITDPAAGEHTYYAQIVKIDGTTETVKLAVNAAGYEALTCNKLTWSGNSVTAKAYMDVILQPTAAGYAIAHVQGDKDCTKLSQVVAHDGLTTLAAMSDTITNASGWTVTAMTKVVDGAGNNNYFVDTNTKFVVVSGFGSGLTIKTYAGVAELLGENEAATIGGASIVSASQIYTANVTSKNYHVDYILIEKVTMDPANDLVYVADATKLGYDNNADYYNVYFNGVEKQIAVKKDTVLADNTFYSYEIKGGVYVLTLPAAGCIENYTLTVVEGTAYLYVNDAKGDQWPITENAVLVNLTNAKNVPTTAADLMVAAENNTVKVDVEIVGGAVAVVYIYEYTNA